MQDSGVYRMMTDAQLSKRSTAPFSICSASPAPGHVSCPPTQPPTAPVNHAFDKCSGHVVPKCCRKGGGRWAMTLKGKEY